MRPWEVLGIQKTTDIKTIKLAYSKQLKLNRPNEKPQEFQILHEAYKDALKIAKQNNAQNLYHPKELNEVNLSHEPIFDNTDAVDNAHYSNFNFSIEFSNPSDTVQTSKNEFEIEFRKLIALTKDNIQKPSFQQTIEQWQTFLDSDYIFDPEFNFLLGTQAFLLISNYNFEHPKKSQRVPSKILNYLNDIFNWHTHFDYLHQAAGKKQADKIFYYLKNSQNFNTETKAIYSLLGGDSIIEINSDLRGNVDLDQQLPDRFTRLIAFIIDLIILVPVIYYLNINITKLLHNYESQSNLHLVTIMSVIAFYYLFTEISPLQASLGKYLLKLRVVDKGFHRLGFWHTVWRTTLFCITLMFHALTIIINYLLGKRLLHDRLSKSLVMRVIKKKHHL